MLKLFEVTGFRCFQETVSLDFSDVRDYHFNSACITSGLITNMIIYGKNAIGKSNFGSALFDIAMRYPLREDFFDATYLNTHNPNQYAMFRYVFKFKDEQVEYVYRKNAPNKLIYEKIILNDELLLEYDRDCAANCDTKGIAELSPTLILDFEKVVSVFDYVVANVPLDIEHPLRLTRDYIARMKLLGSSGSRFSSGHRRLLPSVLLSSDGLREFNDFLCSAGVHEEVIVLKDNEGPEELYFNTTPPLPFYRAASSGTRTLLDFFIAYKRAVIKDTSLLFLDEFDSFYHFELAENLVKLLERIENTQVIITSHNTKLLNNRIMRPDCYFIMTKDKLTSFANATERELREGHNLEKLFISGEFGE